MSIPYVDSHKNLGLILSEDLSWDKHYKDITACTYKTLRLVRRTFVPTHSPSTLVRLYVSLVRSQLLYCTQVWRPHLMKDIVNFERIQCCATKYILNDYISCSVQRLFDKSSFIMYIFELQDILFTIKTIKLQTNQFNINNYITFNSTNTRSGASNKLYRYLNTLTTYYDILLSSFSYHPCGMPCQF